MSTYWYESGRYVLLFLSPQHPAPGRFLGSADLTRSELDLLERIVSDEALAKPFPRSVS